MKNWNIEQKNIKLWSRISGARISHYSVIESGTRRLRRPSRLQMDSYYKCVAAAEFDFHFIYLKHKQSKALIYKSQYFGRNHFANSIQQVIYCAQFITAKYFRDPTGERPRAFVCPLQEIGALLWTCLM